MASTTTLVVDAHDAATGPTVSPRARDRRRRTIDRYRLSGRSTNVALVAAALAAIGQALGTVMIGRVAEQPSWGRVASLAVCLVGAAVIDTAGRVVWGAVVDRAEGRLRDDLLDAVMQQPVADLAEQAVGEVLDRVDDDTHELGTLLRLSAWRVIRLAFVAIPLLIVAGLTWWPAWFLMPVAAAIVSVLVRPLLGPLAGLKVAEEAAWTDHAAVMEEGIAARDDLRTSLGQPYILRRCAELSAAIHTRMGAVVAVERAIMRRSGLVLHALLATVAVIGVLLTASGAMSTAMLVTLFAVTVTFVGQIDQVAHHLPDLQAGVGALVRLRGVMAAESEPVGGAVVPHGPLDIELRDLHFAYPNGQFALDGIDLTVEAGTTCALVGRSGAGKSTLASLLSRAVDPPPGTVFIGGVDVTTLDLEALRSAVGLVTQRTEIIAGTLAENIAMFADVERGRLDDAIDELGLRAWVDGLPAGLDTVLGPSGTALSAGEEQLVAFARLLVRDVAVIVLDEATARMDPVTEAQVVNASRRLLQGRTALLIAHRLGTTERAEQIAVLDAGRLVQSGPRRVLAREDGPFRRLLDDAGSAVEHGPGAPAHGAPGTHTNGVPAPHANGVPGTHANGVRRRGEPPPPVDVPPPPSLRSSVWKALRIHPEWGLTAVGLFLAAILLGAYGVVTNWLWGQIVVRLDDGGRPVGLVALLVLCLATAPLALAEAIRRYPHWWIAVMLRTRLSVLIGQTDQRRLPPTPPGEVVARAMDCDRYTRYVDRWVDFGLGLVIAAATAAIAQSALAGAVLLVVMAFTAVSSALGSPAAGRSAAAASTARAEFGRALVSSLDAIRTVKLSAATASVSAHLRRIDGGRVDAAVREHRIQSALDGVPLVMVQSGVVAAWAIHVAGGWGLSTALLVSGAVAGFEWFARVAGAVITEAPGVRAWQQETSRLAGGRELVDIPSDIDLVHGSGRRAEPGAVDRLARLALRGFGAVHDDGTVGVHDIDLTIERGELVLVLGRIGSGKSSLLRALAGLVHPTGSVAWNGAVVDDPEAFLRPSRVAYVAQIPRVLSGTFVDNVRLDHDRDASWSIEHARLSRDIAFAGGPEVAVGHRGVRLSGGQVQRLALARALATNSELLVADDVSSALDATTEIELWEMMRASGRTVIGATTKRSALARADRVVVLVDGTMAALGPWSELARRGITSPGDPDDPGSRGVTRMTRTRGVTRMTRTRGVTRMTRTRGVTRMTRTRGVTRMTRVVTVETPSRVRPR